MSYEHYSMSLDQVQLPVGDLCSLEGHKILFIGKQCGELSRQIQMSLSDNIIDSLITVESTNEAINRFDSITNLGLVVCDAELSLEELESIASKYNVITTETPFIVYSEAFSEEHKSTALKTHYIDDFLYSDMGLNSIVSRFSFLMCLKNNLSDFHIGQNRKLLPQRGRLAKRFLDIFTASVLLVLLSPILLFIAIIIKLESPGPAMFISKRVGTGYNIFNFYKFRSMRVGADNLRNDLSSMNEYQPDGEKNSHSPFFFKIKNDPRVTRIGKFLRKTSLDELPQLVNVLKGDMSLVGNRPLPLDEAATLTEDRSATRFLAPSGITGLWQVSKRKDEVSVPERIKMDLKYTKNSSFRNDLKILWKTVPAMLQR